MAGPSRRQATPLKDQLFAVPERFEFFQAVRLLERLALEAGDRFPVGGDRPAELEAVNFRAWQALRFPAGEIARLTSAASAPPELSVVFFGLTGPSGVLPQHYTAMLIARVRARDRALADFLDQFNHRLLSHFYRAWEKHRLPAALDRARAEQRGDDLGSRVLYSLAGAGTGGVRGRIAAPDELFIYFSGHLAHQPHSASALQALIQEYFALPTRIEEFHGQWLYLEPPDRARMPEFGEKRGLNAQLGVDAVIGQRVWDVQSKFRVRLGPMNYSAFRQFLPNGDAIRPLNEIVRLFAGPEFDFDVQPVLQAEAVPLCQLCHTESERPRLGWNTWVRSHNFGAPATDAVFPAAGC